MRGADRGLRLSTVCAAILAMIWLALPGTSSADHVNIEGGVQAAETGIEPARVAIRVSFDLTCAGASGGASFQVDINMVDEKTSAERYLGGHSSGSGVIDTYETRGEEDRQVYATLEANCALARD